MGGLSPPTSKELENNMAWINWHDCNNLLDMQLCPISWLQWLQKKFASRLNIILIACWPTNSYSITQRLLQMPYGKWLHQDKSVMNKVNVAPPALRNSCWLIGLTIAQPCTWTSYAIISSWYWVLSRSFIKQNLTKSTGSPSKRLKIPTASDRGDSCQTVAGSSPSIASLLPDVSQQP